MSAIRCFFVRGSIPYWSPAWIAVDGGEHDVAQRLGGYVRHMVRVGTTAALNQRVNNLLADPTAYCDCALLTQVHSYQ